MVIYSLFDEETIFAFLLAILSLLVILHISEFFALGGDNHPDNVMQHKDIISQLPDDILVSIIARTPTKFAVSTSILSKRWRHLYKSTSIFQLYCHDFLLNCWDSKHESDCGVIIHRLERFLSVCSGFKIHDIVLEICLAESYRNQYDQCIFFLGKSAVEKLYIIHSCRARTDASFFWHLLLNLPSLKQLSVYFGSLQPNLNSKCYSLQMLHLLRLDLAPGSLECILSNCSALQSLTISRCSCPPKFCISSPNLKLNTLIFDSCKGISVVEVHAIHLTTFDFKGDKMASFVFDYVPQLENVCISFNFVPNNLIPFVAGKLSEDLPHLKSLSFGTTCDFDQGSIGLVPLRIVSFSNLRRLDMSVHCTPRTNLLALSRFLETFPLLEDFHLDVRSMDIDVCRPTQRKAVIFHDRKLKIVEMSGFRGTDNEIEFALYILKSAVALNQMFIVRCMRCCAGVGIWRKYFAAPWTEETCNKIEQQLQGQAVSNTAKLMIMHESIL